MTPARLTTARLRQLATQLPDRHTLLLLHLSRARVLNGGQLDRLLHHPDTPVPATQRVRQRAMTHLQQLGLVSTLHRRIGGARAGSAGHVHVLTPAGHKLAAILTGTQIPRPVRRFRAPGPMLITHALDIAEIYVQLTQTSKTSDFHTAVFITEPATWWPTSNGGHLRPDAYTVLAAHNHKDCWWLEIDRDTESLPRLRDKLHYYLDHTETNGTGPDGAIPRVLITTPSPQRCTAIATLITDLPPPADQLFHVAEHSNATDQLIAMLLDH